MYKIFLLALTACALTLSAGAQQTSSGDVTLTLPSGDNVTVTVTVRTGKPNSPAASTGSSASSSNSAIDGFTYASQSTLPLPLAVGPMAPLGRFRLFGPNDRFYQKAPAELPLDNDRLVSLYDRKVPHRAAFDATYGGWNLKFTPNIPYNVVDSAAADTPMVTVSFYDSWAPYESERVRIPIPAWAAVEGGAATQVSIDKQGYTPDNHLIVIDKRTGLLYECGGFFWHGRRGNSGPEAGSCYVFDVMQPLSEQRPRTFTSADAAGLSIFMGLIRPEEVKAGKITHTTRFTGKMSKELWRPATHTAATAQGDAQGAGSIWSIPSDFSLIKAGPQASTILKGWQEYGLILSDNGGAYAIGAGSESDYENFATDAGQIGNSGFPLKMSNVQMRDSSGLPELKVKAPTIASVACVVSASGASTRICAVSVTGDPSLLVVDGYGAFRSGQATIGPFPTAGKLTIYAQNLAGRSAPFVF